MLSLPGSRSHNRRSGLNTLVVGAGEAGRTLVRALRRSPNYGLVPIGFLDDARGLTRAVGLPVFGPISALAEIARARQADACSRSTPSGWTPPRSSRPPEPPGCTSGSCRRFWPPWNAMRAFPTCARSEWGICLAAANCT